MQSTIETSPAPWAAVKPAQATPDNPVLSGQNIICFAKDWSETPTSNNHVMAELAKANKVLWLNSIATRTPNLASGRDIKKIFKKLASFLKGPTHIKDNLWVYTPIVLPLPYSRWASALLDERLQLSGALAIDAIPPDAGIGTWLKRVTRRSAILK